MPDRLNHLPNGGFERTAIGDPRSLAPGDWEPYGQGYTLDTAERHSGGSSIRCVNHAGDTTAGALCRQTLNQTVPTPIVVSGWSKAKDVAGESNSDYAIYVDLAYTDGTNLWAQTAAFDTGTHGWQHRHLVIVPSKPLRSMSVYALFRNHAGTAWFDDFDAHEIPADRLFDGQELTRPALPANADAGWFIRNAAATTIRPAKGSGSIDGVKIMENKSQSGGRIVSLSLRNKASAPRCITVYYAERTAPRNAVWWNDITDSVRVASHGEYGNLESVGVGANGHMSLYPFGCVTGDGVGRALAIPPAQQPRVARIVYNAHSHLLYAAFDIALAAAGDRAGHDRTALSVARYDVDPAWGFRDAAAKFYALFPDAYRRRAVKEGIWMPFSVPAHIKNAGDFHFAYHEGDNSVASDRKLGVLSFRYVEPMSYWMPMDKTVPRTYENALAMARHQAAGVVKDPTDTNYQNDAVRQSQAVLNSGTKDMQGRFNVAFRDAPWCNGAVWVLNPNPALPVPAGQWSKARLNSLGKPNPRKVNEPDGEFLDSLEMWANTLDYRPESLTHAGEVATFTPGSLNPVLPTWFEVYDSTRSLSSDLHRRGKLLMANATPWGFTTFGPLLDVMGTETDMFTNGQWTPEPEDRFNLRRTLCYHKPYLLLLNTDYTKLDSAKIELYFQRCLFYGVFPSMFSANSADHPYWENPQLYERDRPLFKKYLPVISRISSAGWEPVTLARSSANGIRLERYGIRYLTVLNTGVSAQTASIAVEPRWIAAAHAGKAGIAVMDTITGQRLGTIGGSSRRITLTIAPSQTRVLSLIPVATQ